MLRPNSPTIWELRCLARNSDLAAAVRQNNPTGKFLRNFGNSVKPQNKKYFAFPEGQIRGTSIAIPSRSEGRFMIATNVGRVAVDAGSAENERRESVRQSRVVLTPRCWRQVARGSRPGCRRR